MIENLAGIIDKPSQKKKPNPSSSHQPYLEYCLYIQYLCQNESYPPITIAPWATCPPSTI